MLLFFDFSLPFTDPVLVFFIALLIILFAPILLRKIKIPSIVGLIIAGVLIGPHGFNLLLRDSSIVLFGTIGLLYIMFLAALELDMEEFRKKLHRSIIFGGLIFCIPIITGIPVCYYFLDMNLMTSVFVANIFSTFTLVSYPIVSRLGITKNEVVVLAVGGVIIADTSVLLLMSTLLAVSDGTINSIFALRFIISISLFAFIVLWLFPKIGRLFFRYVISDSTSQYIFVLAMVFASAFLSRLAGVEPIIGAFLAGLSLNRLIPRFSPLMNRIEFVGNALFIPFFLISVGMVVDLKIIFNGNEALIIAATFIAVALSTKWVATFITQKIFGYTTLQRKLLFGLSTSKAAATIAIVLIGYNAGIVNENVLNGTILLILVTCLVSSIITDSSGKKIAIEETQAKPIIAEPPERILVPISNPVTIEQMLDFAIMIKRPNSEEPIFPLAVVKDGQESKDKIIESNKMLQQAVVHASATENKVQVVTRVDPNITNGILRAVKELMISDVVMGWHGKSNTTDKIFGTTLGGILHKSEQMIIVTRILIPLNTVQRVMVVVPPNAEKEIGFIRWVRKTKRLSKQTGAPLTYFCTKETEKSIFSIVGGLKPKMNAQFRHFENWRSFESLSKMVTPDDFFVVISARRGSVSYDKVLENILSLLGRLFKNRSFIIIYPEQIAGAISDRILQLGEFSNVPITENIKRIGRFGKFLGNFFSKKNI